MALAARYLRAGPAALSSSMLLPRLSAEPTILASSRWAVLYAHELSHPLLPRLALGIPAVSIRLPSFVEDIWEAILRAVPKQKTSHSKTRSRQMAGKGLKDMTSFCTCPGCGQTKRMHRLCPTCMKRIKQIWREDNPSGKFA